MLLKKSKKYSEELGSMKSIIVGIVLVIVCFVFYYNDIGYLFNHIIQVKKAEINNPIIQVKNVEVNNPISQVKKTEINNSTIKIYAGHWKKKPLISLKRKKIVDAINMKYRQKNNMWFPSFVRNDGNCGTKFVMNQKYQAQCSGLSEKPCCNDKLGKCGNSKAYCECRPFCTDYSNIIYPEFYDWVEKYPETNFDSTSTCRFFDEKFSSMIFIGDSLMRQFFAALFIHLTNDNKNGGMIHGFNESFYTRCGDENQFSDLYCRGFLARTEEDQISNPKFCKNVNIRTKLQSKTVQKVAIWENAINIINSNLKNVNPDKIVLFVVGIGIHDNFNSSLVWNNYLYRIIKAINSHKHSNHAYLIWSSAHASGVMKLLQFYESQGSPNALKFNKKIQSYLKPYNVTIMNNFDVSYGVYSFDGTHYGQALNMVKVRLFVKLLKHIFA